VGKKRRRGLVNKAQKGKGGRKIGGSTRASVTKSLFASGKGKGDRSQRPEGEFQKKKKRSLERKGPRVLKTLGEKMWGPRKLL